ncbi:hypothetical protein AVEN_233028-1 [Araneus ventricosus]|uniref:Uncharacterized protein n=1 Tax=Araneus ventricosus TaxID=182803 RepID=A0A4Y2P4V8_ARAVE|nr:hypothetical protein AVEN_233028-1 [Araneus ventricosus]
MNLSEDRRNSSIAEAIVLMTIPDYDPTPPAGGTYPNHYCSLWISDTTLTYPAASHPRTRGSSQTAMRVQALLNLLLSHCSKLIELQGIFPGCKQQFKTYAKLNLVHILLLSLHHLVTKTPGKM